MTLLHFVNCVALSSAPYIITYRYSGLVEVGAFWKCLKAGGAYILTQLVKMLLLATFFPVSELDNGVDMMEESIKCTVDMVDALGLYLVLTRLLGKGEMKIVITATGWGVAELLSTRLLPLWFGARATEFSWKYVQSGFDANLNMVFLLSLCTFLWLWSRTDLNPTLLPVVGVALVFLCYRPLLFYFVDTVLNIAGWSLLLFKGSVAVVTGFVALLLCTGMNKK